MVVRYFKLSEHFASGTEGNYKNPHDDSLCRTAIRTRDLARLCNSGNHHMKGLLPALKYLFPVQLEQQQSHKLHCQYDIEGWIWGFLQFSTWYSFRGRREKQKIQTIRQQQQPTKKVLRRENLPVGFFYLHNTTCEIYICYPRDIFTPKLVIDGLFLHLLLPCLCLILTKTTTTKLETITSCAGLLLDGPKSHTS